MNFDLTDIGFSAVEFPEFNFQYDKEEKKYSCWQESAGEFFPALDLKMHEKLPSGCYKITWDNRNGSYKITSIKMGTDDAYRFENSYSDTILNEVQKFWSKSQLYKDNGLIHKRGLLLEGPAGNGKSVIISLLIEDLLKEDGLVFIVNNVTEYQHTLDAIPTVVNKIEKDRKIIIVIEDIDKILMSNRGDDSQLLDILDGKNSIDHQLVIMTSNDTTDLSVALLRPSRVDMRFCIELPEDRIRREYLQRKGIPEEKLEEYVKQTEGMSFAQLKEIFVGTMILDKSIDEVVSQLKNTIIGKDYLNTKINLGI